MKFANQIARELRSRIEMNANYKTVYSVGLNNPFSVLVVCMRSVDNTGKEVSLSAVSESVRD